MTKFQSNPPAIGPNAICCRFFYSVVVVDRDSGVIEFRHCHVPRRFLAEKQRSFWCSTADIKAVHFQRGRRKKNQGGLTVVTTTGRAFVPETGSSFDELREWLAEIVPSNQPEFSTDNPAIGHVYVLGALVGLLSGVFLTMNAGNMPLGFAMVFGAIFGIVGGHLLVYLGGRWLKIDFTQHVEYGMFGFTAGLGISTAFRPLIGGNLAAMAAIVVAGTVFGVLAGVKKRSVKKQMAAPSDTPKSPVGRELES